MGHDVVDGQVVEHDLLTRRVLRAAVVYYRDLRDGRARVTGDHGAEAVLDRGRTAPALVAPHVAMRRGSKPVHAGRRAGGPGHRRQVAIARTVRSVAEADYEPGSVA